MQAASKLFRVEALNSRQPKWLGEIVLIRPLSFTFLTAVAAICAGTVIAFLAFGAYTKRNTVVGQLVPDTGLIKVYAPQFGIVKKKFVVEGQVVRQGDALYVLSSERQSSTQGNTQAAISDRVIARERSLREQLDKTRRLQQDERNTLIKKTDGLRAELQQLGTQIDAQRARVKLAEETLRRYQELVSKNYVSVETLQQKQADLLDQKLRLQSLERDRIGINRDLGSQESDLAALPLKNQNQLAEIERSISATGQELTESEAKRDLVVTATENGLATAVLADVGQATDASKPMVSIVPQGAVLQAYLYAPSKAIGFVKPGDSVLLRYQAFPYQKFGRATGTVVSVSRTALPASEVAALTSSNLANNAEPMYRITVALSAQTIVAYGKPQALQVGMLLEADVLHETRRLYEWVLEPLYSLTGKL